MFLRIVPFSITLRTLRYLTAEQAGGKIPEFFPDTHTKKTSPHFGVGGDGKKLTFFHSIIAFSIVEEVGIGGNKFQCCVIEPNLILSDDYRFVFGPDNINPWSP